VNLVSSSPLGVAPEKLQGSAHGISKAAAAVFTRTLPVAAARGAAPTPAAVDSQSSSQSNWKSNWQSMLAELSGTMNEELNGAVTENINGQSLDVEDQSHSMQDLSVTSSSESMPSATPSVPVHLAASMTPNLPNLILASNVRQRSFPEAIVTPAMTSFAPQPSRQMAGTQTGHRSLSSDGSSTPSRSPSTIKTALNQNASSINASSVVPSEVPRLPLALSDQPIQPSASVEMSSHPPSVPQESHSDHEPSSLNSVSSSVPGSVSDLVLDSASVSVPTAVAGPDSRSVSRSVLSSVSGTVAPDRTEHMVPAVAQHTNGSSDEPEPVDAAPSDLSVSNSISTQSSPHPEFRSVPDSFTMSKPTDESAPSLFARAAAMKSIPVQVPEAKATPEPSDSIQLAAHSAVPAAAHPEAAEPVPVRPSSRSLRGLLTDEPIARIAVPTALPANAMTTVPVHTGSAVVANAVDRSLPTAAGIVPTSRDTFAALDSDSTAPAATWIHAGARHAEAGYLDPSLGWVGVRADSTGATLHASIVPGTVEAAQTLGIHMGGLNEWLSEQHGQGAELTMAAPENGFAGSSGNSQGNTGDPSHHNTSSEPATNSDRADGSLAVASQDMSVGLYSSAPAIQTQGHISVIA
jgi:hypothetical protein